MKNIDYRVFVPRGEINYIRFNKEEFLIDDIATVNLHLSNDKVTYWIYFKIPADAYHNNLLLRRGRIVPEPMVLLLGNNPYEIHGTAEVQSNNYLKHKDKREIVVSFVVENASKNYRNYRKEVEIERSEILDLDID